MFCQCSPVFSHHFHANDLPKGKTPAQMMLYITKIEIQGKQQLFVASSKEINGFPLQFKFPSKLYHSRLQIQSIRQNCTHCHNRLDISFLRSHIWCQCPKHSSHISLGFDGLQTAQAKTTRCQNDHLVKAILWPVLES